MKLPLRAEPTSGNRFNLPLAALWLGASMLAAHGAQAHKAKAPPLTMAAASQQSAQQNGPGADFPVTLGEAYSIGNTQYVPADVMNYDAVGIVAVDGQGAGVSAAHHTLPIPSYVEITSLTSGRTILVRVDRRGPMDSNRVISLSAGAAAQLGLADHDTVRVRRVNPPESERAVLRAGGMASERMPTPQPLLAVLIRRLAPDEPVSLTSAAQGGAAQGAAAGSGAMAGGMVAPVAQMPPQTAAMPASDLAPAPASEPVAPAAPKGKHARSAPRPAPAPQYAPPAQAYAAPAPQYPAPQYGAQYAPPAQQYAAPAPQYAPPARQVAPPAQQYAPSPPAEAAPEAQPQTQQGPAPVPFHSYLIQPLRRGPDGAVLLPGTDVPTYASSSPYSNAPANSGAYARGNSGTPYANTPAYSGNGDLAGQPTAGASYTNRQQPAQTSATTRAPEPFHSYLIRPLSRTMPQSEPSTPADTARSSHAHAKAKPHKEPKPKHRKPIETPEETAATLPAHHASAHKHASDTPDDTASPDASAPYASPSEAPGKPAAHHASTHKHAIGALEETTPPASASYASAPASGGGNLVVQAGAFSVRGRAEQVAEKVGGSVSMSGRMWRVRSGPFSSRAEAEVALAKAKAAGYSGARIQRAD